MTAISKSRRTIDSDDVQNAVHSQERGIMMPLFVRKNKDDQTSKEFYFLGEIFAEGEPQPIHMESTNDDAFEILYRLDVPVRSDIYDYIVRD